VPADPQPVVLVVEDDLEMNDLERELLAVNGFDSVAAHTGREALEVVGQGRTDAVLLDVMLPEMDGFETCLRLRRSDHRGLVIVMVSALDGSEHRRRGYEVGADAYFAKPFDPDEIVEALRSLLEKAG
jgi:DNA-binding response OmpR family regulator